MSLGSNGPNHGTRMNVMYGEEPLEQVSSFVYLGVEILETGSIHSVEAPLIHKATWAQFRLSHLTASLPLETILWLYQRMVDPILLHGSEVWSVIGIARNIRQLGIYDTLRDGGKQDLIREKMRRDFLRCKIGFTRNTPLLGIRGGTGMRPLYMDAISRALNYFEVIAQEKASSLLGITLRTERELLAEGHDG